MSVSTIILTKNPGDKLDDCLKSAKELSDEIIILDDHSIDGTLEKAKKYKARVIEQRTGSYNTWRNQGRDEARYEWLFYIDPDERVTPVLRNELRNTLRNNPKFAAYAIPRRNFVFGKELKHGGWYPDYVARLIKKDKLIRWEGELHEQPKIDGELGYFKNSFIHLKEDKLSDMVVKTNKWSQVEAKLLLDSDHPPMVWWRFIRPVVSEVFDRLIIKLGFLDGVQGIIFSIYQGYSRFMTYAKLWEMQRNQ